MQLTRHWILASLTAALLAACGGGGGDPTLPGFNGPSGAPTAKGSFAAVVSFGDSLSDAGTYAPATSVTANGQPPYFGGKFSTNSPSATVWVQNVATALGLDVTVAQTGFGPLPVVDCPAADSSCTAYGQGGSRVTDPNGIGKTGGALTVPVQTQIANHLARFGGFGETDLVFVFAGANDAFVQFGAFATAAGQAQAQAASGAITAAQANGLLLAAQVAAQAEMKKAALELAGYVRSEILAKGGKYVAVVNLPDIADTPFGGAVPASALPTLTSLSEVFNLWLREGLAGQPVQWVDSLALFKGVKADPAAYGITNNAVPACDAAKISVVTGGQVTDGSSLFCNVANGLRTGADATTWFFADSVHPTTGGHQVFTDYVLDQLTAFGWI